jgi:Concanavalin A-like lectin/glucanases superfamily
MITIYNLFFNRGGSILMNKEIVTKSIVIATMLLFLGASVVPTIFAGDIKINNSSISFASNLVAYWSFDDSSDVGHDDSENGNQGLNNGATWVSDGVIGGALDFDGSNDYVEFSSPVLGQPPYSICAWVKPESIPENVNQYILANGGEIGTHNGFFINIEWQEIYNGDYSFGVGTENVFKGHSTYHPATTNWTFLCGTWDGIADISHIKLYVNGVLVGNSVSNPPIAGSVLNLIIGSSSNHKGYFDGLIDEVRIYNKELNAGEISDLNNILGCNIQGGRGISVNITNIGPTNATNVDWQINVKGGLLGLINVNKSGTIETIALGESVTVGTGMFLGLGKIQITLKVDEDTKTANATQLFIFTRM